MLDNEPFNQARSYPTWREANSLPYIGGVVIRPAGLQFSGVTARLGRNGFFRYISRVNLLCRTDKNVQKTLWIMVVFDPLTNVLV